MSRSGVLWSPRESLASGVCCYTTDLDTAAHFSAFGTNIVSAMLKWASFETSKGTFVYGNLNGASNGIADAHDNGYLILLRISAGVDAPIGRPAGGQASWLFDDYSCERLRLFDNDSPTTPDREVYIPVPWSTVLRTHFIDLLKELNAWMSGDCPRDSSHARKAHIIGVTSSMPTENGTEMPISYGTAATYSGSATLSTTMTAGSPTDAGTFTLSGIAGFPASGKMLLKIGSELVFCSRSGSTFTVQTSGRGFSGSVAASHAIGAGVTWADDSTTTGTPSSLASYRGLSGIYDHQVNNRAEWDANDGTGANETTRQDSTRDAWVNGLNDHLSLMPADIPTLWSPGALFGDNMVRALAMIDTFASFRHRILAFPSNLRASPVRSVVTDPMPTYQASLSTFHTWVRKAQAAGFHLAAQTAGVSITGAHQGQEIIDACEAFLGTYPVRFIETNANSRFTASTYTTFAADGWPGGTTKTMKQYFVTDPNNLQDRLRGA